MNAKLICHERYHLGEKRGLSQQIYVIDMSNQVIPKYELMCAVIDGDIQSAEGSGATALKLIQQIESGEEDRIDADGNAWIAIITRDKV